MSPKARNQTTDALAPRRIAPLIHEFRAERVILDVDLAAIYGVTVKALNQAVKRNIDRFPEDFAFRLTQDEFNSLRSQFATSNTTSDRSQFVTGPQKHRNPRYPPYAFTEHGAIMAANVLNSEQAMQMSVFVVRAFVKLRETLATHKQLAAFRGGLLPGPVARQPHSKRFFIGRNARQGNCFNSDDDSKSDRTRKQECARDWLSLQE